MASWTAIANLALRRMGSDRITNITDPQARAEAMNDVYEIVRDDVLRAHPWNCALVRAQLSADDLAPAYGWLAQFTLPADPYCLRVWRIEGEPDYVVEGRKILCNEAGPLNVLFIGRVTDPEQFDANLVVALAAHMAAMTAFRITQSRTAETEMKAWAKESLMTARTPDAQEGTPEDIEADDLLRSRY